ncbi:MAG: phytanoyl-CoA dioxygenase family protein [Erythrobacter sp.]
MNPAKPTDDPSDYDVSAAWDQDNQAWWDWYVGLADESEGDGGQHALVDVALEPDPRQFDVLPLAELREELARPYALPKGAEGAFRKQSYIKLPGVLSPRAVRTLRAEIVSVLSQTFATALDQPPPAAADGARAQAAEGRRFFSAEMVWLDNPVIAAFTLSPRIAQICAKLLGVEAVRLYHDNLLSKEPGCGRTPWHYDDHHFPLATNQVVTAWIAAQAIPRAMGPLAFATGIDTWKTVADIPFSKADTSYDRRVAETFRAADVTVDDGAFAAGEVSFHHNLNFHTAGPNRTTLSRCVLANTFFEDGARLVDEPTMVSGDWRKFLPGVEPGGIAASDLNPICWPTDDNRAAQGSADAPTHSE